MSYVSEAAELFLSLNPDTPFLSPFDYLLISEWEKQEIPLAIVLRSIREFSANTGNSTQEPFGYLRQEIKANYTAWLNASPANL